MMRVLVTGATGNAGSQVVQELRERGVPIRAFVREPKRALAILGDGIELAVGDFAEPDSIARAMEGVQAVLLSSANHPRQAEYEMNVVDAAVAAGVRRIVKLSTIGARAGSPLEFFDWHGRSEEYLRASGLPATILQSSFYMSNLLASADVIRQTGKLLAPAGGAHIAMVDPRDVGAVAAVVLTEEGHDGDAYLLSGPEAVTYDDVARELSAATGREIEFVNVPDEAMRQAMLKQGAPDWMARNLVILFGMLRDGVSAKVTGTVRALTGHAPRTVAGFARDHARLFGANGPARLDTSVSG